MLDLNEKQLEDWAVLDTLDGMYAQFEYPMSYKKVHALLEKLKAKVLFSDKKFNAFRTAPRG